MYKHGGFLPLSDSGHCVLCPRHLKAHMAQRRKVWEAQKAWDRGNCWSTARHKATNTAVCGYCGRTAWKPAALSATASAKWSRVPQLASAPSPSRGRWCRSSHRRYTGGHLWARALSSSDLFLLAHSACRSFCSLFQGWSWYPHWCRQSPSLLSSRLIE